MKPAPRNRPLKTVNLKPKPILLCTARHTGSYTLRRLIETSADVPIAMLGGSRVPLYGPLDSQAIGRPHQRPQDTLLRAHLEGYAQGGIPELLFIDAVNRARFIADCDNRCLNDALLDEAAETARHYGYTLPERIPRGEFFFEHACEAFRTAADKFTLVAAVRDSVLSIITALRKDGDAAACVESINALAATPGVHYYNVADMTPESAIEFFATIEITPTAHTVRFAQLAPQLNATFIDGRGRREYSLERKGSPRELRAAKRLWLHHRQVHPLIAPWLDQLNESAVSS